MRSVKVGKLKKKKKKKGHYSLGLLVWFFCIISLKNPVPCSVLFWADRVSTTFQNARARGEKKKVILQKIILLSRG